MRAGGLEMSSSLREVIIAANRNNVTIHTLDPRQLGEARMVSDANYALSNDTGGRRIGLTNDFTRPLQAVMADASSYYLLGYESPATRHRREVPEDQRRRAPGRRARDRAQRLLGAATRGAAHRRRGVGRAGGSARCRRCARHAQGSVAARRRHRLGRSSTARLRGSPGHRDLRDACGARAGPAHRRNRSRYHGPRWREISSRASRRSGRRLDRAVPDLAWPAADVRDREECGRRGDGQLVA